MENMQEEICSTSKDFPTGSHSHDGRKIKATEEKALKAVLSAEASRCLYATINSILGKQQSPPTQIDVLSPEQNPIHPHTTLPKKKKMLSNH